MSDMTDFLDSVDAFEDKVSSTMAGPINLATVSDNTDKLSGNSLESMKNTTNTPFTNHVNNKNNPHNTTAAQLNAYTVEEFNQLLGLKFPPGVLPISSFGNLHSLDTSDPASNITLTPTGAPNTWLLNFNLTNYSVLVDGLFENWTLDTITVDMTGFTTLYCDFFIQKNAARQPSGSFFSMVMNANPNPGTQYGHYKNQLHIGQLEINGVGQIVTTTIGKRIAFRGYKPTLIPDENAIAVSNGAPMMSTADMYWGQ